MQTLTPNIFNQYKEKIDTLVEWSSDSIKATVVMVHGLGTDKNETANYFVDVSRALVADGYRVVRFDLTGYGKSDGLQREACYSKHTKDLKVIIDYVKSIYQEPIYIFAQSMGCFVTSLACPDGISKTIMTGLPNADTNVIIKRVTDRFGSREGAVLDVDGISLLPRSTGKIQEIGPQFWKDIRDLKPLEVVEEYSKKTNLLVVSWLNDEILGKESLDDYDNIKTLKHIWLPGDHSVSDHTDRNNFIKYMLDFFND